MCKTIKWQIYLWEFYTHKIFYGSLANRKYDEKFASYTFFDIFFWTFFVYFFILCYFCLFWTFWYLLSLVMLIFILIIKLKKITSWAADFKFYSSQKKHNNDLLWAGCKKNTSLKSLIEHDLKSKNRVMIDNAQINFDVFFSLWKCNVNGKHILID